MEEFLILDEYDAPSLKGMLFMERLGGNKVRATDGPEAGRIYHARRLEAERLGAALSDADYCCIMGVGSLDELMGDEEDEDEAVG